MKYEYEVFLDPQNEGGFTAYIPLLPGCVSQGETKAEAVKNIKEAAEVYLKSLKSRGISPPQEDD